MKVLEVVHYFLPRHQAGTEIYAAAVARELAAQGHEVEIFTSEDGSPPSGKPEIVTHEWEGLKVHRLLLPPPAKFEDTYINPAVDEVFAKFLESFQPGAVHFQHTFRLSAGMIPAARKSGAAVLVTLADFWFICPPILLLQPGLIRCPGPEPERCARCGNSIGVLYSGGAAGSAARKIKDGFINAAHSVKRKLPEGMVAKIREWKQTRELNDPESGFLFRKGLIEARMKTMAECLAAADLVIAPSEFLLQRMLSARAVAPSKIVLSDYGFDHSPFKGLAHSDKEQQRVGFIGTPVEHKGVHVAVDAMNYLPSATFDLLVYGDLSWFPAYARRLKKLAKSTRVKFMGRFEHDKIGEILAGLDLLIVPSLWYENSPLTIHEAFMAGTPVIVSNLGGMSELVRSGGGLVFNPGDPQDLAATLAEALHNPSRIKKLRSSIPKVKSIAENVEELVSWYKQFTGRG